MRIKKVKSDDARVLTSIDKIAYKEMKFWAPQSEKDFKKSIKNPRFYFSIAEINNKLVGYLESEYDKDKKIVWIKNVFILKQFRKKGLGKLLVNDCIKHWNKKVDLLILLTANRNLKTFEKLGFKKTMNYMMRKI